MFLLKSLIDILMVLLLIRLLIKPTEAFIDPIYRLIFRVTDPLLVPSRYVTRDAVKGVLLSLAALVVLRGVIYNAMQPMSIMTGIGISLLNLLQLVFKGYMVIWFVSLLSQGFYRLSFMGLVERAFIPLNRIFRRMGIKKRQFHLSAFLFLWIVYSLISMIIRYIIMPSSILSSLPVHYGFGEGIFLILGLFPFPGFFSLVIIIGALLSWVSPDPSNPIVQAIYGISEPLLMPFRRFIPLLGGIDISPIVALFCFQILGGVGQQIVGNLMKAH